MPSRAPRDCWLTVGLVRSTRRTDQPCNGHKVRAGADQHRRVPGSVVERHTCSRVPKKRRQSIDRKGRIAALFLKATSPGDYAVLQVSIT